MPLASVSPAGPRFLALHPFGNPSPAHGTLTAAPYSMDAALMLFQHDAIWLKLIIGDAPARALDSQLVPVRSQSTPVTAEPPTRCPARTAAQAHLAGPAAPSGHLSATIGA